MSETPDTTAAFEAEAEKIDAENRRAQLEAELAEMDKDEDTAVSGELVVDDENDDETITPDEIEVDGRTWRYFPPSEGQFTVFAMASSQAKGLTNEKRMRRLYGFLENLFTDDDFEEALHLVEDRNVDFDFASLMDIVTKIAERVSNSEPKNRAQRRAVERGKKAS